MSITANKGYKMNLQAEFKAVSGKSQITKTGVFTHIEVVALYVPPEGGGEHGAGARGRPRAHRRHGVLTPPPP